MAVGGSSVNRETDAWGPKGPGKSDSKVLTHVAQGEQGRLQSQEGLEGCGERLWPQCLEDLGSFSGFSCCCPPPAGAALSLGRRSGGLSLSSPGWQLLRGIMPGAVHEKC